MHIRDDELVTGLADQVEGSALTAATYARVPTSVGFTRMLSPLGNYFIARPAARARAPDPDHRDGDHPGRKWQKLSITLDGGHDVELEARGASHALVASYREQTGPVR